MKPIALSEAKKLLEPASILTEDQQQTIKGGGCYDDKRRERPGTSGLELDVDDAFEVMDDFEFDD